MGRKCIPGVFCIENMTLFLLFVIILLLAYFYYQMSKVGQIQRQTHDASSKIIIIDSATTNPPFINGVSTRNDIFNDPYSPPLKTDGVYFRRDSGDVRGIPVNIQTHGTGMNYQQVGILTREHVADPDKMIGNNSEPTILPLFGRPIYFGSNKWSYYTTSDKFQAVKLPINIDNRKCTDDLGCDELRDGDMVTIPSYNGRFKVEIYDFDKPRYIPFVY